uniref:Uncharacterized protein n=1 Tax=Periophthalmus magnuspinnatus TaxID=409849 RepID=A0A3B3ZA25_9GOBI
MKEVHTFNITVLGDTAVGKSSLLERYTHNVFSQFIELTIGAQAFVRSLNVEPGVHVKLLIWDTAGVERCRSLTLCYYRHSVGGLLVFNIARRATFESIKQWHAELCKVKSEVVLMLVGNWCDEVRREVSREEAERLAEELDMPYVETSAKTGQNVSEVFENLTRRIYQRLSGDLLANLSNIGPLRIGHATTNLQ